MKLEAFNAKMAQLQDMAWTAMDCAPCTEEYDAIDGAWEDAKQLAHQARGLVEVWPHREEEFVDQANALMAAHEKLIRDKYNVFARNRYRWGY